MSIRVIDENIKYIYQNQGEDHKSPLFRLYDNNNTLQFQVNSTGTTITNLIVVNETITNLTATNATITNLTATTSTLANITTNNVTISGSGTLNAPSSTIIFGFLSGPLNISSSGTIKVIPSGVQPNVINTLYCFWPRISNRRVLFTLAGGSNTQINWSGATTTLNTYTITPSPGSESNYVNAFNNQKWNFPLGGLFLIQFSVTLVVFNVSGHSNLIRINYTSDNTNYLPISGALITQQSAATSNPIISCSVVQYFDPTQTSLQNIYCDIAVDDTQTNATAEIRFTQLYPGTP